MEATLLPRRNPSNSPDTTPGLTLLCVQVPNLAEINMAYLRDGNLAKELGAFKILVHAVILIYLDSRNEEERRLAVAGDECSSHDTDGVGLLSNKPVP